MSDIFHEIEEDIRREKLDKMWEQYGSWIMIVFGVAVIGIAGYLWWGEATERRNGVISDEYLAANELLASGDDEAGLAALEAIIANRSGGYVILSSMQKAAKLAADGKIGEAVQTYDAIRSSNKTDDILGQLAAIKAGWLIVETEEYQVMQGRLGEIAMADVEGPWAATATEILAYSAMRAGNLEEAEALYLKITGGVAEFGAPIPMSSASPGTYGRASEMLSVIQPKIVRTQPGLVLDSVLVPDSEASVEPDTTEGDTTETEPTTTPEGE